MNNFFLTEIWSSVNRIWIQMLWFFKKNIYNWLKQLTLTTVDTRCSEKKKELKATGCTSVFCKVDAISYTKPEANYQNQS